MNKLKRLLKCNVSGRVGCVLEPISAANLTTYYASPKTAAYEFQTTMLQKRIACVGNNFNPANTVIIRDGDSSVDRAFELVHYRQGNINDDQHEKYKDMARWISGFERADVIVYLVASPETCLSRVMTRGRPMERETVDLTYMCKVCNAFEYVCRDAPNVIELDANRDPDELAWSVCVQVVARFPRIV